MTPEAEAAHRPCARFWGSDGTLCATHNGRFVSPSETRCTKAEAAHREPRTVREYALALLDAIDAWDQPNIHGWGVALRNAMEREDALAAEPIAASSRLDEAWAEAEAALPEGWLIVELERSYRLTKGKKPGLRRSGWMVKAHPERNPESEWAFGPTPAAALRALAERLRATPEPEPPEGERP